MVLVNQKIKRNVLNLWWRLELMCAHFIFSHFFPTESQAFTLMYFFIPWLINQFGPFNFQNQFLALNCSKSFKNPMWAYFYGCGILSLSMGLCWVVEWSEDTCRLIATYLQDDQVVNNSPKVRFTWWFSFVFWGWGTHSLNAENTKFLLFNYIIQSLQIRNIFIVDLQGNVL